MRNSKGFTLIELCLVTGIISLLLSMAAPVYSVYINRAKSAEAIVQVETLAYLEHVRILELGEPIACGPHPKTIPTKPTFFPFDAHDCWADLGFKLSGRVRFQYETERQGETGFSVFARGDLNADGVVIEHSIDSATMNVVPRRITL